MKIMSGGASRKGLILPETCPLHSMEQGPCRTQGYPLSPGEIITPRRGDRSTEPGPYSPSITANLFIGILTIRAHGCCHGKASFFIPPPSTQLAVQHIYYIKICLAAPLLLPSLPHHMRWYVAYHNRVMSIKTLMSLSTIVIFTAKVSH